MKYLINKPNLSNLEKKYVLNALKTTWLSSNGYNTKIFERKFSKITKNKYSLAVQSGTAALHLALDALGIRSGDKVFVPTLTFAASAEVISYFNAKPIFLDVDYSTGLITPKILEKAIKNHPDSKAIILVHYAGQSAQMFSNSNQQGILDICKSAGIQIIEDAAHAFPTKCNS